MTTLYLRTRADERQPSRGLLLDWFGRGGASTVSGTFADLTRGIGEPDPTALDLLRLAVAVYAADKAVPRDSAPDRWRRALRLHVPVSDRKTWAAAGPAFSAALEFLTNDAWELRFRTGHAEAAGPARPLFGANAVCLFSGGLDSLAGAIDLLEDGRTVFLVGHYDSNLLLPRQQHLYEQLRRHYGEDRVLHRAFYLRLASASATQARPLPSERERTTRSRSFLFIASATIVASILGLGRIHMPENGYIGLNIPLEISRLGACSTRTTHPHFMQRLAEAFTSAHLTFEISNPYRMRTKAEVLRGCRNLPLLRRLALHTVSCAHAEVGRWRGEGYRNCGYCYPCLMRRVSLHHLGDDDPAAYGVDVGDPGFLGGGGSRTEHLRALIANDRGRPRPTDVLRSGPLPRGEVQQFMNLYERGRNEISAWLAAAVPASA